MKKVCNNLETKIDLFREEELKTVLKGLKHDKAPGADSAENDFFKYSDVKL